MQNFPSNPVNGSSPFAAAGPLFKTVQGEAVQASPISQSSPFAAQGAPSGNVPLTVGDVLPQLPPELIRLNALPPEQPVAISVQVLDAALRSGQAALPIFEIYRVCPALFQSPVSPQDPRMVPLPASKLPRLIASTQGNTPAGPGPAAVSPFGAAVAAPAPAATPSPFSAVGNAGPGSPLTSLPPRRNGPPPPLADIPRQESAPPSLSLPGNSNAQVFPASPFATVAPQPGSPVASSPSPFSAKPPEASPAAPAQPTFTAPQGGLFSGSSPTSPGASPFAPAPSSPASSATPAGGIPSPFAVSASAPPSQPPAESPFSSLFGSKASPTGQPAPDAPARQAPQNVFGPAPSAACGPSLRLSLASLVKGYSAAELGFDPIMVPTWIMTSLPASTVREWAQSPNPLVELGALVDGITDVGFRNVLSQAKRDFQLRVPQDEVNGALAGNAGAAVSQPASPPAPVSQGAATMRVGPAPQGDAFVQPVAETAPQAPAPSFFGQADPAAAPTVPLFGMPGGSPPASPSSGFTAAPAPQPVPEPPAAPAASSSFPFATGAVSPSSAAFGAEPPPPAPSAFGAEPPAPAPVPAAGAAFAPAAGFEPVAPLAEGFSSAQLLGTQAADAFGGVPPAPSIPVTNPFTGKLATAVVDVPEEKEPASPEPAAFFPPEPENKPSAPPPVSLFGSSASARTETPFPSATVSAAATAAAPRPAGASGVSALGIHSHNTHPDQILLRALLATDDQLTPQRVVEMMCSLPGIAACVCLHGSRSLSHVGAHKPQAREFQKQATDLAHHLRTLAPLIGIEGAETFTLTSGDRLMTFCFPEGAILGILHDAEPSLGLRDKITLIARELARMLA